MHGNGVRVGHNTVQLLTRRAGLAGLPIHRRVKRSSPAAGSVIDLVKRQFRRDGPNQLWVTDITEHPTREGKLSCCVVLDTTPAASLAAAPVINIDLRQRADLASNALGMAIESRGDLAG